MNQTITATQNYKTNDSYKLTTTVSVEVSRSVFLPGILAPDDSDFTVSSRTSPLGAKAGMPFSLRSLIPSPKFMCFFFGQKNINYSNLLQLA